MKHEAAFKIVFVVFLLTLSASHANAALMHFTVDASQSQFSGSMSITGQIRVSGVLSDTAAISSMGTFAGPVSGTIDANVDTPTSTLGFQGIALSSAVSGSLSPSATLYGLPVTADIAVTYATVDLAAASPSSPLTATGIGGLYFWGPTAMTLDIGMDYSATLNTFGLPLSQYSDTALITLPLTDATGSVTLDASGNPIGYALGMSGPFLIPLSISGTSGGYTVAFTGNLTLNELSLELRGNSTVVPVPTAVWLFGSGLLGLIGVARRHNGSRAQ
jgi:hypothetical protein